VAERVVELRPETPLVDAAWETWDRDARHGGGLLAGALAAMSATYGPLGVAIVLLLWLYLSGRVMVASAMLNATLWDRRRRGERNYGPLDLRSFRPVR
jgi:hypothetical protein